MRTALLAATAALLLAGASSSAAAAPAAAATIVDGIYVITRDVAPGTYRAVAPVGPDCYWWTYYFRGDFVPGHPDQPIPGNFTGGGHDVPGTRPTVELVDGQGYQAWHCGTWERIR